MQLNNNGDDYQLLPDKDTPIDENISTPFPKVKTGLFFISVFTVISQTYWSGHHLYKDSDKILGLLSAGIFVGDIATPSFSFTHIFRTLDALTRIDSEAEMKTCCEKILGYAIAGTVALVCAFAILMSCLDPGASILSSISHGATFYIVGLLLGVPSAIGDFFGRVQFYAPAVIDNMTGVMKDLKHSWQESYKTRFAKFLQIAIMISASMAYSLFYKLYLTSSITTLISITSISADPAHLKNILLVLNTIAMSMTGINNFISSYKKMGAILQNPKLIYTITEKNGDPLLRTVCGSVAQIIGFVDMLCSLYSDIKLSLEFSPHIVTRSIFITGAVFYSLSYLGFSVNAGSALGATRLDNHLGITQKLCGFFCNNTSAEERESYPLDTPPKSGSKSEEPEWRVPLMTDGASDFTINPVL